MKIALRSIRYQMHCGMKGYLKTFCMLMLFLSSAHSVLCAQEQDIEALGDDHPEDQEISEVFIPESKSQIAVDIMMGLSGAKTPSGYTSAMFVCPELKLKYHDGFADTEKILGLPRPLGTYTPAAYKDETFLPVNRQHFYEGQKSYWKPIESPYYKLFLGKYYSIQNYIDKQLEIAAESSSEELTEEKKKEIISSAENDFQSEALTYYVNNPDPDIVGWSKWQVSKIDEPLLITKETAEKFNITPEAMGIDESKFEVANFIIEDTSTSDKNIHDGYLEKYGFRRERFRERFTVTGNTVVQPVIHVSITPRKDAMAYYGQDYTQVKQLLTIRIAYELCSQPTIRKPQGSYKELWDAEQARIESMYKDWSAVYFKNEDFELPPYTYNHAAEEPPVTLAFWNHMRGRLSNTEQRFGQVEITREILKMPARVLSLVHPALWPVAAAADITDYVQCEEQYAAKCRARLAFDLALPFATYLKAGKTAGKVAMGYMRLTKGSKALKKAFESADGVDEFIYLVRAEKIIQKNARAAELLAAGGNGIFAAYLIAQGDIIEAVGRAAASTVQVGAAVITERSISFVPLKNAIPKPLLENFTLKTTRVKSKITDQLEKPSVHIDQPNTPYVSPYGLRRERVLNRDGSDYKFHRTIQINGQRTVESTVIDRGAFYTVALGETEGPVIADWVVKLSRLANFRKSGGKIYFMLLHGRNDKKLIEAVNRAADDAEVGLAEVVWNLSCNAGNMTHCGSWTAKLLKGKKKVIALNDSFAGRGQLMMSSDTDDRVYISVVRQLESLDQRSSDQAMVRKFSDGYYYEYEEIDENTFSTFEYVNGKVVEESFDVRTFVNSMPYVELFDPNNAAHLLHNDFRYRDFGEYQKTLIRKTVSSVDGLTYHEPFASSQEEKELLASLYVELSETFPRAQTGSLTPVRALRLMPAGQPGTFITDTTGLISLDSLDIRRLQSRIGGLSGQQAYNEISSATSEMYLQYMHFADSHFAPADVYGYYTFKDAQVGDPKSNYYFTIRPDISAWKIRDSHGSTVEPYLFWENPFEIVSREEAHNLDY